MAEKPLCFIISPIGEAGSQTRQDADDLLSIIIEPALDIYNFRVLRGDHRSEANQIDVDVIQCVQEAELCIADISRDNVNVFYEIGRRDETGKPLILLRSRSSGPLPVDIAARRYIEYDLDSRSGIRDARAQLRNFIQPLVDSGFERSRSSSLSDISAVLHRVERKIDSLTSGSGTKIVSGTPQTQPIHNIPKGVSPVDSFKLAIKQNNIPLMEEALDQLQVRVDKWKFLDYFATIAASRGSKKAGEIVLANAEAFIDNSDMSFEKKGEYLSCTVSFLNRTDQELDYLDFIQRLCERLLQISEGADPDDVSNIHNQLNRLYYGIFTSTEELSWLEMARKELMLAIEMCQKPSYFYNLAMCNLKFGDHESLEKAKESIDQMFVLGTDRDKKDADHLEMAYKIYNRLGDPAASEFLERLREVNPIRAQLLEMNE